jgi:hypothetical protein
MRLPAIWAFVGYKLPGSPPHRTAIFRSRTEPASIPAAAFALLESAALQPANKLLCAEECHLALSLSDGIVNVDVGAASAGEVQAQSVRAESKA